MPGEFLGKRENPELPIQVHAAHSFTRSCRCIVWRAEPRRYVLLSDSGNKT
jgi:hypothetical protein